MKVKAKAFRLGGRAIKVSMIDRKPKKCDCGCGSYFVPWQRRQRFLDARHKAIWHKRRATEKVAHAKYPR